MSEPSMKRMKREFQLLMESVKESPVKEEIAAKLSKLSNPVSVSSLNENPKQQRSKRES